MEEIDLFVNLIANIITIIASGIAIYIFLNNKDKLKSAINFILNYSNQLTLWDLKFKIERLNDYNANDSHQKEEVINILHEIEGQINGSIILQDKLQPQIEKIKTLISNPKNLIEAKKRSIVSELRESLRNIDAANYEDLINSKHK